MAGTLAESTSARAPEGAPGPAAPLPSDFARTHRTTPGLRLQIVLALAGLMVLAFVPLFFAVASLTRATILGARDRTAHAVAAAIAAHVADALDGKGDEAAADAARRAIDAHVAPAGDVTSACFVRGPIAACAGPDAETGALRRAARTRAGARRAGTGIEIVLPAAGGVVAARVDAGEAEGGASLVRLVALYMIVFALALLVFAYFSLTRLIVRPVEQLVDAADRIAGGARTLRVPPSGARELVDLATSFRSMAEKLIAEEAALILKVDELTETTRRLTDTRAQLVRSERMASVGRLAAGVAHEIGNPIAALMGMEDLLLDGGLDEAERRDFLQRMRRETDRIHVVLRDLLDFARPEEPARPDAEPTITDIAGVVDDVVALVGPQKPFRTVQVERDLTPGLAVTLPASRLTQVLLNLVLNAGAAAAARVRIRARPEARGVRIEIEDDGPGIAPEIRDRLFEPFATTKQVGEGTGLGLAVCRGLVESAGGEIGVDPRYTGGARFYVLLPTPP